MDYPSTELEANAENETSPKSQTKRYPTMEDVAERVGVHATTVSLALRSHPSIPAHTRARILEAAEAIGYVRDARLDAFNNHRRLTTESRTVGSIAFVADAGNCEGSIESNHHPLVFEGVRAAAAEAGFSVDLFPLGNRDTGDARLNTILRSRGVSGVLLANFSPVHRPIALDWGNFSIVKIDSLHVLPDFDAVTTDHGHAVRLAFRELRSSGYRRLGVMAATTAISSDEDVAAETWVEQSRLPENDRVPVFRIPPTGLINGAEVAAWVRRHSVDAIVTNFPGLLERKSAQDIRILNTRLRVPHDIALVSLDCAPEAADVAGVVQNRRLVGKRAMEQLSILVRTYQRGKPASAAVTYVPSYWRNGPTAPTRSS